MAFVLIIIGIVLLVTSVRNTQGNLYTLVQGEFTGTNNFIFWLLAILLIGAIGYVPKLKPISTAFLTLVIVVLFLTKGNPSSTGGGFFANLAQGLQSTTTPQTANSLPTLAPGQTPLAQWGPGAGSSPFALPSLTNTTSLPTFNPTIA